MSGILKKHAEDNWYTRTYNDFERRLEAGKLPIGALRSWDCYGARCPDCNESVTAFKYKGERYYLHNTNETWYIHQCCYPADQPEPEYGEGDDIAAAQMEARGEIYPDDPNVRDGDGEIRGDDWSDPGREPRSFADPVYGWPDIPYVDPTR